MNPILVALDASSRAPNVLRAAIALGRTQNAKLLLMRSVGLPVEVPQDLWRSSDLGLVDVLELRAQEYLTDCAARVPAELREGTLVVVGTPWQAICDTARDRRCILIVIGSHGYSGIDRLLGTTASRVVNHAPCSVLVVRDPPAD